MDSTMTIRLNSDEKSLINAYAKVFGTTASQLMRKATLEMIEDSIDLKAFEEAKHGFAADSTTYSIDEVKAMLDL